MPTVAQYDQPLPGSLEEAQQRYESTKKALKSGIAKKRQIDRALTDIESQIFLFEGSYLATTAASGGNIVKGFDGYLKSTATGGHSSKAAAAAALAASAADVPIEDRMFSQSSATYTRSLQLKANEGRSREQSPTVSTGKKGDRAADRDAPSTPSGERTKEKKKEKSSKDDGGLASGEGSTKKGHANSSAVDATPSSGKSKKREREKDASVNGSHKKKRKDDD